MKLVLCDTSPIRALDWIDAMQILPDLFGGVIVPPAVAEELLRCDQRYRRIDVTTLAFVEVRSPAPTEFLTSLLDELDQGEAEALALAMELDADLVVMDESDGRQMARKLGLHVVGTMGLLLEAKRKGLLPELKPLIAELREGLGFYLADVVVRDVLAQAGEAN